MKRYLIFLMCLCLFGCYKPISTKIFLEKQGYTDVKIVGWRPFMGSNEDFFSTGFVAKNNNGNIVSGTVTEGLILKGKTIRYD
jgi:hypothetical protein